IILLEQQDGHSVHFLYQQGTHLLNSIIDEMGHEISIIRNQGYWSVNSYDINGQPVTTRIASQYNRINEIRLPSDSDQSIVPAIHINYIHGYLLSSVEYPFGMKKTINYNCSDAMKFFLHNNLIPKSLCVVADEWVNPGANQPEMKVNYYYTTANNKHNYLGFNAGVSFFLGRKRDFLFEAPVSYTYHTIKDNGLIKEVRTWNKYHLLINTQLISDRTGHLLSEVKSYFCNKDDADGCAHTRFSDLPATYSLPLKTVTRIWEADNDLPATDTEINSYDDYGRIISHKDAYGRVTVTRYCPLKGDGIACPPVSPKWYFSRLPKSVTLYPANKSNLPAVTRYNFYRELANFHGAGYTLVLDHQTLRANNLWATVTRNYYDKPDDMLSYGLLKKIILQGNVGPSSSLTSVVHNYYYIKSSDNRRETIYSTIALDANKFQSLPTLTTSLFTHQVLMRSDRAGQNITLYHYDVSGHLLQADLAVGTAFTNSVHYRYIFSHKQNYVIITSANGLKKKITFDGLGRRLMYFKTAISSTEKVKPDLWQLKSKTDYDAYGRINKQYSFTEDTSGKITALITTKDYDETGRVLQTHLPDGETAINKYSDADRCMVSYLHSHSGLNSAFYVVHTNTLNKPILKQIFSASATVPANAKLLCHLKIKSAQVKEIHFFYDAFGRLVKSVDSMGKVIKKCYDALGRITDIVNPEQDIIHLQYNLLGKVIAQWMLPATGGRYLLHTAGYNQAGQLLWKAGEDGGKTSFTYTPAGQIETITTPAKHKIFVQYNSIGLPVAKYLNGHLLQRTGYDAVTALPVSKSDITGKTVLTYSVDHLLIQLVHTGKNNYPNYHLFWKYDNNRRIISLSDISGNQTRITYDHLGRNAALYYQSKIRSTPEILSVPVYDDFSRISSIRYGSGMQRTVSYDSWGREQEVTDKIADKLLMYWHFSYDRNGNIATLIQQTENDQQAVFNYRYDKLNNLTSMVCTGSAGLPLCPRDIAVTGSNLHDTPIITRQNYTFTPLNRLSQVRETLQNQQNQRTLRKIITYRYNHLQAPLRLYKISTQWNQQPVTVHYFNYDIVGNMTTDGEGNHINYNAFNQIVSVITASGKQSSYAYDGTGKEILEKSDSGTRFLFYRDRDLINEQIKVYGQKNHTVGYQGVAKTLDSQIYQYYENNYKGDIISILEKVSDNEPYQLRQRNIYSPYGMCWHSMSVFQSLYQQNLTGFNGERTDSVTGWQFLGAGHRTYNPVMRYFFSEDPAGNGYIFGNNNPIMNTDPSGNISKGVNTAFKILGYIGSLGMRAIPKRWAAITGMVISAGLMAACSGLSLTLPALIMNSGFVGAPVAAAAFPSNRGLNIAAAVVGLVQFTIFIASTFASFIDVAYGVVSARNDIAAAELLVNESEVESSITSSTFSINNLYNDSEESDENFFNAMLHDAKILADKLNRRIPRIVVNDYYRPYIYMEFTTDIKDVHDSLISIYGADVIRSEIRVALLVLYRKNQALFIDSLSRVLTSIARTSTETYNTQNEIPHLSEFLQLFIKSSYGPASVSVADLCAEYQDAAIIEHQNMLTFLENVNESWVAIQFTPNYRVQYIQADSLADLFSDAVTDNGMTLEIDRYYEVAD
ncbi:MAG: hypothetical protein OXC48_08900, partial [Endozoicomonadaceae bacterium]|nr:hypothetical protein [Endozoicomonadaceae bacterium]